ncbi:hypothetical protein [Poseidonibacter sp.]|uniref:hypothetical protein n=2 Tax=Poseidonibacter sp. TaxID=2321188 RepID=UPI003C76537C
MKTSLLILCTSIFLVACAQNSLEETQSKKSLPNWILNPESGANGKLAGSGCSKIHYKGIEAQKKLAISRAIEQIAIQKKVKINTSTYRNKLNQNGVISSTSKNSSLQEVEDLNISSTVKEIYLKENGDICAWVIEN